MSSSQPPSAAPVDPPIPVPDVPGADAGARGLPRRVDLTLRQRLIVDSSAIADLGLRTALASVVGAAMLPQLALAALNGSGAKEQRDALQFYAELGTAKDPELSFPAPTEVPRISSRPANPVAEWIANGRVHNIRFNSSFEAVNPAMRDRCGSYERNNVVHAQHWRHDDGPHPTLCVIHGFMGSAYLFNGLFFSLPWFYRSGYDILLYTLAIPRPSRRKVLSLQRLRVVRQRRCRLRRGDGTGRTRLPVADRLSGVHRRRPGRADRNVAWVATPRH